MHSFALLQCQAIVSSGTVIEETAFVSHWQSSKDDQSVTFLSCHRRKSHSTYYSDTAKS